VHLTGSRTEGKHAVLCLKSAAFEKASTVDAIFLLRSSGVQVYGLQINLWTR